MGLSEFDPAARERVSWNAGRKVGAKRALKPRQFWAIHFFLDQHGRIRDRAFFGGCDLVKIRISDIVCDRKIRTRATVVQQKTGRPVQFELMDDVRASLLQWLELRGGALEDHAFPAAPTTRPMLAHDNMPALLTNGSPESACQAKIMVPIPCGGEPRRLSLTKPLEISAPCKSCWGIRKLKARSDPRGGCGRRTDTG